MNFKEPNTSTNASALNSFEDEREIELPAAYRSFLLGTNGGYGPEDCDISISGVGST